MSRHRICLDTSALSTLFRVTPEAAAHRARVRKTIAAREVFVSFVVRAELLFWAERRSWGRKRRDELDAELEPFVVLQPTGRTEELWADIKGSAHRRGVALGDNDVWIAASALEYELPILTFDNDFARIPGLMLV